MNDLMELHREWIRESNLIEGIDDPQADAESFEAWKKFTENKLTKDTILTLHWDMLKRLNPTICGSFRRCNVRVGGYHAPEWKLVPNLVREWLRVHAKAKTKETIRLAHIIFERIHPFQDGNGRVGRMIMNYQSLAAGVDPVVLYAEKRHLYYKWFEEFDERQGRSWMKKLQTAQESTKESQA